MPCWSKCWFFIQICPFVDGPVRVFDDGLLLIGSIMDQDSWSKSLGSVWTGPKSTWYRNCKFWGSWNLYFIKWNSKCSKFLSALSHSKSRFNLSIPSIRRFKSGQFVFWSIGVQTGDPSTFEQITASRFRRFSRFLKNSRMIPIKVV